MATRTQIKERTSEKVRRDGAAFPWQYKLLSLACGAILAVGFFYAAKQHFSSIAMSIKNSELRRNKEKLDADLRKSRAERDTVASEANIEKAGLKIGLRKLTSDDFQFIDAAVKSSSPAADNKAKLAAVANKFEAAKVTKTVSVRPAETGKKDTGVQSGKADIARVVAKDMSRMLVAKK